MRRRGGAAVPAMVPSELRKSCEEAGSVNIIGESGGVWASRPRADGHVEEDAAHDNCSMSLEILDRALVLYGLRARGKRAASVNLFAECIESETTRC
jgi:hypothetical protein